MNKLKQLRIERDLSQEEVGKIIGISGQALGLYENGKRDIPTKNLLKLANFYDVSADYILGKTKLRKNNEYEEKNKYIPVLGIVKAGYNYLADENIIGYVSVNDNTLKSEDFFALEVKGNSMEPIIYEKDIAIVKKQEEFENGDIVVALINGDEATIKRAYKNERGIVLQPANPMIEPLKFEKEQIVNLPVKIIGIVYNITRKFK